MDYISACIFFNAHSVLVRLQVVFRNDKGLCNSGPSSKPHHQSSVKCSIIPGWHCNDGEGINKIAWQLCQHWIQKHFWTKPQTTAGPLRKTDVLISKDSYNSFPVALWKVRLQTSWSCFNSWKQKTYSVFFLN